MDSMTPTPSSAPASERERQLREVFAYPEMPYMAPAVAAEAIKMLAKAGFGSVAAARNAALEEAAQLCEVAHGAHVDWGDSHPIVRARHDGCAEIANKLYEQINALKTKAPDTGEEG